MQTRKICSGVDLRILEEHKFKTNTLSIFFHIPLSRKTVTKAALLPSVLKRGCQKYPHTIDIAKHLTDLYSASLSAGVRTKGDGEVIYFSVEYISDAYAGESLTEKIAEFLKEFIFSPLTEDGSFLSEYVSSEKINLKNSILGLINDKKDYADVKCREAMFGKEGYGMFEAGYAEDLDDITPCNLYAFYTDVLANAKIDIFAGGTLTEASIGEICRILSPELSPRNGGYTKTEPAASSRSEIQYITEEINAVQSKLAIGFCCDTDAISDDYYALMLGSCIFGGSPVSKLFLNVREKLSLAYYASCRTDRLKSVMLVSSGIETENYQVALDEIMAQFKKMQDGDITDAELEAAKKYFSNGLPALKDSMRTIEDYYLSQVIIGQEQSIDELLSRLNGVTALQIQAVMRKVKPDTVFFLKGCAADESEGE